MFVAIFCTVVTSIVILGLSKGLIPFSLKLIRRDARHLYRSVFFFGTMWYTKHLNLTVNKLFERTAKKVPNKICFKFDDENWTFRQVRDETNRIGNYFKKEGFRKGDRIGLFMSNSPEYVCMWLGLAKIGVVAALLNTNLRLKSLQHCLRTGLCKGIIYGADLAQVIEELKSNGLVEEDTKLYWYSSKSMGVTSNKLKAVDLSDEITRSSADLPTVTEPINYDDELLYIYTSGTTGLPKAAVFKHSRYVYYASAFQYMAGVRPTDVIYGCLPLYHTNSGTHGTGQAILCGNTFVIGKKFSASNFWSECVKHEATVFQYIGEVCRYLLAQPVRPDETQHKIRLILGNGLRPEIWREFVNRFRIKDVLEFYGSTEGNCGMICFDNTVGAVGFVPKVLLPLFPIYLIRVDNDGNVVRNPETGFAIQCGDDEPGEVVGVISKRTAASDFQGYTDPEEQRKKVLCDVFKKGDKVFRSGDILVRDENGYYYFQDRQGDTFRWKGENVSTAEVENVISVGVGLRDAVVYGVVVPGTDGCAGMAAIVDEDGTLDLMALATTVTTQLPAYARPYFIRIRERVDITGTYKFKKNDLKMEGFDITKVTDPLYFLLHENYVLLDPALYKSIISGTTRF